MIEYKEKEGIIYLKDRIDDDSEGEKCDMQGYRIRKLTPLECWLLMGFSEEDYIAAKTGDREKAKQLISQYEHDRHFDMMQLIDSKEMSKMSKTQLYKQAGNSIVVNVLYLIYKNLFDAMPYLFDKLSVSSFFSGIGAFESALDKLYEDINTVPT